MREANILLGAIIFLLDQAATKAGPGDVAAEAGRHKHALAALLAEEVPEEEVDPQP